MNYDNYIYIPLAAGWVLLGSVAGTWHLKASSCFGATLIRA